MICLSDSFRNSTKKFYENLSICFCKNSSRYCSTILFLEFHIKSFSKSLRNCFGDISKYSSSRPKRSSVIFFPTSQSIFFTENSFGCSFISYFGNFSTNSTPCAPLDIHSVTKHIIRLQRSKFQQNNWLNFQKYFAGSNIKC